ncbi:hypothetical protein MNBD_GAMMA07-2052 [hydrothermal vent metagenome]|uniref:histidine kinase n=1 Tax=hydrothermal vent metagenome TaxID=652676 RepID=A0A3B0X764_9ZZZZ
MHENKQLKSCLTSSANYFNTIPAAVWIISFIFLITITAVTVYSISQVNHLEKTTRDLLQAAIPLKDFSNHLNTRVKKAELFLHKFLVLHDIDYFFAAEKEIQQQQAILASLSSLLTDSPQAFAVMQQLQTDLNNYLTTIHNLKNHSTGNISIELEKIIESKSIELISSINQLAIDRASTTIKTGKHVTHLLLLLIIGTAISGILISFLYAAAAIQPIRRIRRALKRIGEGKFDQNLDLEGFQELRELSDSINQMQQKLRELEQSKTEFLSMISHELKTPLASFQTGIGLLQSGGAGKLTQSQEKVIHIMQKQTLMLDTSIQEMLDMQAIQAQRMVMNIRPSRLSDIIHSTIEQISPLTTEKKQRIHLLASCNTIMVMVDPNRTQQILLNLLSNANKYSPSNSQITVSVVCNNQYAELIIEDEGPGIPEALLDVAFERFFQVPDTNIHQRGTGLGLAIVKEIAESQSGGVKLENRAQKGLRVRIELPLKSTVTPSSEIQIKTQEACLENVS